jgi:hypothetical protein
MKRMPTVFANEPLGEIPYSKAHIDARDREIKRQRDEIADLKTANALAHNLITNRDQKIDRLRAALKGAEIALARDQDIDGAMKCILAVREQEVPK